MKIINHSYLFTEKDGELDKIMSELAELPDDYPAIFAACSEDFLERAVQAFVRSKNGRHRTTLHKIVMDNNEYMAFLTEPNSDFSEKLKLLYTTTDEGERINIFSEILGSLNEYSAIFTSFSYEKTKKIMSESSELEEGTHPAMNIPLSFIFKTPPFYASDALTRKVNGIMHYEKVIADFMIHVQEWLYSNKEMAMELYDMCPNLQKRDLGDNRVELKNVYITAEIETVYLSMATDRQNRIKRTKILAAVNAVLTHQLLSYAVNHGRAKDSADYMFLFFRSMAQFAANKAVDDGLSRQASRKKGGEALADREALLKLVKKYHRRNQHLSDEDLWKSLREELRKKKKIKVGEKYFITFYVESTDSSDTAGELIQHGPGGSKYPIKFSTFIEYRKGVRN